MRKPFSSVTGRPYAGRNAAILGKRMIEKGYDRQKGWATFEAWNKQRNRIRAGEKGLRVYQPPKEDDEQAVRYVVVFHWDQTVKGYHPTYDDDQWETLTVE